MWFPNINHTLDNCVINKYASSAPPAVLKEKVYF